MDKKDGENHARQAGICLAVGPKGTCGRPLRGGQCRKHGKSVYDYGPLK